MKTENPIQEHPGPAHINRNGTVGTLPEHASPVAYGGRRAPPTRRRVWPWALAVLLIAGVATYFLFFRAGEHEPASGGNGGTITVGAARVTRQDVYNEVPIPAEFRPHVQAQLHAIVTGYVSTMLVDFGDKVKKDQLLATINVPELQDQLNDARANQQQAEADYRNAHLIYTRLEQVNQEHPKLVAQQDLDTARAKDANAAAAVSAAKAKVGELQTRTTCTNITAPFDGVITQRSVDPGALVQAGTSSDRAPELLQISDNYHLRLDFPVSVDHVQDVKVGVPVQVRVDSLHGKVFTGKISRFQSEVNAQTRTMNTEIEIENPDLEIVPGMYAVVLFRFARRPDALTVPNEAISDPRNPSVYLIGPDGRIVARPVKLGVEMPDRFQVTDGLREGDEVMIGNRSQVHPGQRVDVKLVGQPTLSLPPAADGEKNSSSPLSSSTPPPLDPHAATSTPPSAIPDRP